ncbi:hypothetical protein D3C86_1688000 [compost metagenome]
MAVFWLGEKPSESATSICVVVSPNTYSSCWSGRWATMLSGEASVLAKSRPSHTRTSPIFDQAIVCDWGASTRKRFFR